MHRYGDRDGETRTGTVELRILKLYRASCFLGFLERRGMVVKALTSVTRAVHVQGISARSVDYLDKAMGMSGNSKNEVRRLSDEIGDMVKALF